MTYRPGTIKRDQKVDMPRPRDPAAPEFNELKRNLGLLVMEEQQRHEEEELKAAVVDCGPGAVPSVWPLRFFEAPSRVR